MDALIINPKLVLADNCNETYGLKTGPREPLEAPWGHLEALGSIHMGPRFHLGRQL